MHSETLLQIKWYLQRIKHRFINWQIRLIVENGIIKITYKDAFIDFTIKEKLNANDKKAYKQVKDFCLDVYYNNERDGKPLNSQEIAELLDLSDGQVRRILSKIYKQLNKNGEPVLQKE